MDKKYRIYLRDLNQKGLKSLNSEYEEFVKPRNLGFLTTKHKEKLLRLRKWEQETDEGDVSNFFFDIREKAKSAMKDFELICDILTEEQLEMIFGKTKNDEKSLFSELLAKLLPVEEEFKKMEMTKEERVLLESKEWRKYLLSDMIDKGLSWYYYSGIFRTFSHQRTIKDAIDAVSIMVTGEESSSFRHNVAVNISMSGPVA